VKRPMMLAARAIRRHTPINISAGHTTSSVTVQAGEEIDQRQVYGWGGQNILAMKSSTGRVQGGALAQPGGVHVKGLGNLGEGVHCVDQLEDGSFP